MGRLPAPCDDISFQLTAARRRLERGGLAGFTQGCFNSQPPEGGWKNAYVTTGRTIRFNSQPPEGGWIGQLKHRIIQHVSTHSRPKAAGYQLS